VIDLAALVLLGGGASFASAIGVVSTGVVVVFVA
jgi:hypothetical protein